MTEKLIVEVISDSSEEYDHLEKWTHYQTISSLEQYVMVSQNEMKLESYKRIADEWIYSSISNPTDNFKALDCEFQLGELYEKVVF